MYVTKMRENLNKSDYLGSGKHFKMFPNLFQMTKQ